MKAEVQILEQVKTLQGMEQKKKFLISLSSSLRPIADATGKSINELICSIYKSEGVKEMHTFKGWQEEGRKVKKGAKALIIWSAPRKAVKTDQETSEEKQYKFFGIAHLFAMEDTEPLTN